jgi:ATP-binding cassette subfamily F protein 3
LLFVSHDRYFIDKLATKVWAIEDGVLYSYMGHYTEYRAHKQRIAQNTSPGKVVKAVGETKSVAVSSAKSAGKKGSKEKVRTVEDVERDIEKAEVYVRSLEEQLAQAALIADAEQLTQLSTDYEQAKACVDELLEEWEQLANVAS